MDHHTVVTYHGIKLIEIDKAHSLVSSNTIINHFALFWNKSTNLCPELISPSTDHSILKYGDSCYFRCAVNMTRVSYWHLKIRFELNIK